MTILIDLNQADQTKKNEQIMQTDQCKQINANRMQTHENVAGATRLHRYTTTIPRRKPGGTWSRLERSKASFLRSTALPARPREGDLLEPSFERVEPSKSLSYEQFGGFSK